MAWMMMLCPHSYREAIWIVNSELESFAKRNTGVSFVNCGSDMLDSGGRLRAEFFERDGVTLTKAGVGKVATCLSSALEALHSLDGIPYGDIWANRCCRYCLGNAHQGWCDELNSSTS